MFIYPNYIQPESATPFIAIYKSKMSHNKGRLNTQFQLLFSILQLSSVTKHTRIRQDHALEAP